MPDATKLRSGRPLQCRATERRRIRCSGKLGSTCGSVFGLPQSFWRDVRAVWPAYRSAGKKELFERSKISQWLENRTVKPLREIDGLFRSVAETKADAVVSHMTSRDDRDKLFAHGATYSSGAIWLSACSFLARAQFACSSAS